MALKWGSAPQSRTVAFYHRRVSELVAERMRARDEPWEQAVWRPELELTREDFQAIEDELLATGVLFEPSAGVSVAESPHKYATSTVDDVVGGEADEQGRTPVGSGDNVFRVPDDVVGVARYISGVDTVMAMLTDGVPAETVAIIDDSGGTLTAPILAEFTAVVCKGGSVRSHLGILTREYQIPCLMNAEIAGLAEGDHVQVEYTAAPPTFYEDESTRGEGRAPRARVWKLS